MILIAFTNYGDNIVPPALVDWVGFANFGKILSLGQFAPTFFKIFGWNMLWAVLSTAINYFAGLGLALAAKGLSTLLIDGDVGLNNLDVVMGMENRVAYDMADVLAGM